MLNRDLLEQAKAAYDSGNYAGALRGYYTCLKENDGTFEPGEAGLVYHMLGNCLIKMRSFPDAVNAYNKAMLDEDYENITAVHSNCGLALTSLGRYKEAIEQFETVLKDPTYKTPYKTYSGLGNAYMKLGDFASAGTAFRNAAVDDRNPAPVKALLNLGVCFMGLNRPADAIATYKAIFEFNPDQETLDKTYANMGQAYVAMGENEKAVEAFQKALEDDGYQLSDAAQADFLKASTSHDKIDDSGIDVLGDVTDAGAYQPQATAVYNETPFVGDLGEEELGDGIPSANDTGFFTLPDDGPDDLEVLLNQSNTKKKRKGGKVALVIVIILVVIIAAAGVLFWQGFGYPSQETAIETLMSENAAGEDVSNAWISTSSEEDTNHINKIMNSVAKSDDYTIDYMDKGTLTSDAMVTVTLPEGGKVRYEITLSRDFSSFTSWIGWKVSSIELAFPSAQEMYDSATAAADSSSDASSTTTSTDSSSADQSSTSESTEAAGAAESTSASSTTQQ